MPKSSEPQPPIMAEEPPPRDFDAAPQPGGLQGMWFPWMFIVCVAAIIVTIVAQRRTETWAKQEVARRNHEWMLQQAEQIRRGEIDCLVNPDPAFVDELLADAACAAKIRDLYLGSDLSDQRLERLTELPNLKCVVFLFARNYRNLLKSLSGSKTIEELTFERTAIGNEDFAAIGRFPNLKSLAFSEHYKQVSDMHGLHGHPTLQRLSIERAKGDETLLELLQSLPKLRELYLGLSEPDSDPQVKTYENTLSQKLPQCKCKVWDDRR